MSNRKDQRVMTSHPSTEWFEVRGLRQGHGPLLPTPNVLLPPLLTSACSEGLALRVFAQSVRLVNQVSARFYSPGLR